MTITHFIEIKYHYYFTGILYETEQFRKVKRYLVFGSVIQENWGLSQLLQAKINNEIPVKFIVAFPAIFIYFQSTWSPVFSHVSISNQINKHISYH